MSNKQKQNQNNQNKEIALIFPEYFVKIIEELYDRDVPILNDDNLSDITKAYEKKVLFDIIKLSPKSISRITKSHRKSDDEKKILINSNALSHCDISCKGSVETGSYIDIKHKTLVHIKSDSIASIEYDLTKIWKSINDLILFKEKNNLPMFLFTNMNHQNYPLYYNKSNKRHCGFQNNAYKLIKKEFLHKFENNQYITNIFTNITSLNQIFCIMSECDVYITQNRVAEKQPTEKPEITYVEMWKEIFGTIGMLPKDCNCKAYGKAVYNRCVKSGKSLRGIRPIHDGNCSKKLIIPFH